MEEFWSSIWPDLWKFLLGAGGLALISIGQERWKWRASRKAEKEDKAEEKAEAQRQKDSEEAQKLDEISKKLDAFITSQESFNENLAEQDKAMHDRVDALSEGMKFVLLDRILYLGKSYIRRGSVSFDDRKRLGNMHTVYHSRLDGNGDADTVMDIVYELPLEQ